jgi:hypothetical protein
MACPRLSAKASTSWLTLFLKAAQAAEAFIVPLCCAATPPLLQAHAEPLLLRGLREDIDVDGAVPAVLHFTLLFAAVPD